MGWLTAISNLFNLLAEYVRHRTETDLDRRITAARKELRKMAEEIDALRALGSVDSNQRADLMRGEFATESGHLEHLLARRATAKSGAEGADH